MSSDSRDLQDKLVRMGWLSEDSVRAASQEARVRPSGQPESSLTLLSEKYVGVFKPSKEITLKEAASSPTELKMAA